MGEDIVHQKYTDIIIYIIRLLFYGNHYGHSIVTLLSAGSAPVPGQKTAKKYLCLFRSELLEVYLCTGAVYLIICLCVRSFCFVLFCFVLFCLFSFHLHNFFRVICSFTFVVAMILSGVLFAMIYLDAIQTGAAALRVETYSLTYIRHHRLWNTLTKV